MARSIGGFNSSGYGSFSEGDQISARALNRMGVSIDKAQTMFSQGVQFQTSNGGVVYNDVSEPYIASSNPEVIPSLEQFQIVTEGDKLFVRYGTVIWAKHNFGPDEEGNPTVSCGTQTLITTFAPYTGSTATNGTTETGFMNENGYVLLST
jgi:hypothetical protein